jgi:hypothetical protein
MEKIHASFLRDHKELIESLKNTYEKKFEDHQIFFRGNSASYFIDLDKVKNRFKELNPIKEQ